ncbi:hypothetical protein ACH5RR_009995 [Cinchona calisaya]|uniref:CCT domain-containing protein n=1 Tax=Cinchona calisaya TaxID=153742 RepID=A0ABD3AIJ3_9GENT
MNNNETPYAYSSSTDEFLIGHFPSSSLVPPAPLAIPINEYDSLCALKSELNCSSNNSSGCSSYSSPTYATSNTTTYYGSPTSFTSYEAINNNPDLMQRSISSHSLLHNKNIEGFPPPLVSSPNGYYYDSSETSPVRKVFSTGDLEGMNPKQRSHRSESSLANEYSIIESMSKACRYNPEEKKERIERYKSKRNLRNFNKKIKYECRKTLADSRPRIRGRFARNDEIEKISHNQWDHAGVEEDDNWINIIDSFSATLIP